MVLFFQVQTEQAQQQAQAAQQVQVQQVQVQNNQQVNITYNQQVNKINLHILLQKISLVLCDKLLNCFIKKNNFLQILKF